MNIKTTLLATAIVGLFGATAVADDATGVWLRSDGKTKVKFSHCGDALCGAVVWLKDQNSPAHVGQKVFYDMQPVGENLWRGSAFNPDDGRNYAGKMSLAGNSLTTSGCVLGGLICKSFSWTRAN